MKQISIIVPCFNEQEALPYFFRRSTGYARGFLSMNSSGFSWTTAPGDGTLSLLKERAKEDSRIKYISFSRNFGKEAAIYAGLEAAKGDYSCRYGRRSPGSARASAGDDRRR